MERTKCKAQYQKKNMEDDAEFYLRMEEWIGGVAMVALFFSGKLCFLLYLVTVGVERLRVRASNKKKVVEVSVSEDDDCPICLNGGGDWVRLSCNHTFHKKCICMWHEFSKREGLSCPMCRTTSYL